jgi:hypothetical protein
MSKTTRNSIPASTILAEVLRLQRWAGGEAVPADRIYGLLHGFESVLDQENETYGLSRELQDRIEDILDDVENGKQSPEGMLIKQRLLHDRIDETAAAKVIRLCILQGRFPDATGQLTAPSSHFHHLSIQSPPELQWFGSLHYLELVDCTEDAHKKLHACFAPTIPRIGEFLTPENGPRMRVVDVEWVMISQGEDEGQRQNMLVPHVYLECITDSSDSI